MWHLLLFAVITAAPQFQVDAESPSGGEATEIREAVVRALVAGGSRVVLGGNESDCPQCARVRVVEKSGSVFTVEVEQNGRKKSSRLKVNPDAQLLDKARAVAVQVRLLVRPMAEDHPSPKVAERRRPLPAKEVPPSTAPSSAPIVSSGVEILPLPPPSPTPSRGGPSPATGALAPAGPVEPAVKAVDRPTVVAAPLPPASPPSPIRVPPPVAKKVEAATEAEVEAAPTPTITKIKAKALATNARVEASTRSPTPAWPYVPLTVGAVAGVSAVVCGILARDRYAMLSDRNLPYTEAVKARDTGEQLQFAAYVLGGTALAAELVALLGFTSRPIGVTPVASASSEGALFGVTGALP